MSSESRLRRYARSGIALGALVAFFGFMPGIASAATTLLVNTESFDSIDSGDSSSNIELRFGTAIVKGRLFYDVTNNRFQFNRPLFVGGSITATGSLFIKGNISGSTLRIDGNSELQGTVTTSGSILTRQNLTINSDADTNDAVLTFGNNTASQTLKYVHSLQKFQFSKDVSVRGNMSGSSLTVDGASTFQGAATFNGVTTHTAAVKVRASLSGSTLTVDGASALQGQVNASGSLVTRQNITINSDNDTNNAVLTFGNQTAAQSLTYNHSAQRFDFSKDVRVQGNLSGRTLTVDGNVIIHGVTYNFTGSQGGANTFLKNDGGGNLTWASTSAGNGSGSMLSLHPEYPNAVYTASGTTAVGQLAYNYDSTNKENYYHWTSTRGTLQDYWIAVRVKVPQNFSNWEPVPIQFRYRTTDGSAANNYLNVKLLDTAGSLVNISGGTGLANTSWTTASITGVTGTFTPGSYITLLLKLASNSTGAADAGYINLNWTTTTP